MTGPMDKSRLIHELSQAMGKQAERLTGAASVLAHDQRREAVAILERRLPDGFVLECDDPHCNIEVWDGLS
jgi:hypothetical protein